MWRTCKEVRWRARSCNTRRIRNTLAEACNDDDGCSTRGVGNIWTAARRRRRKQQTNMPKFWSNYTPTTAAAAKKAAMQRLWTGDEWIARNKTTTCVRSDFNLTQRGLQMTTGWTKCNAHEWPTSTNHVRSCHQDGLRNHTNLMQNRLHARISNHATVPAPTEFNEQTWKMCRHTIGANSHTATSRNTSPGSKPLNSALFCDLPLVIPHDLVQRSLQHLKCCRPELTKISRRNCYSLDCTGNLIDRTLVHQTIQANVPAARVFVPRSAHMWLHQSERVCLGINHLLQPQRSHFQCLDLPDAFTSGDPTRRRAVHVKRHLNLETKEHQHIACQQDLLGWSTSSAELSHSRACCYHWLFPAERVERRANEECTAWLWLPSIQPSHCRKTHPASPRVFPRRCPTQACLYTVILADSSVLCTLQAKHLKHRIQILWVVFNGRYTVELLAETFQVITLCRDERRRHGSECDLPSPPWTSRFRDPRRNRAHHPCAPPSPPAICRSKKNCGALLWSANDLNTPLVVLPARHPTPVPRRLSERMSTMRPVQYEAPGAKRASQNSCHLYSRPAKRTLNSNSLSPFLQHFSHLVVKCFMPAPSPRWMSRTAPFANRRSNAASAAAVSTSGSTLLWSPSNSSPWPLSSYQHSSTCASIVIAHAPPSPGSDENRILSSESPRGAFNSRISLCLTVSLHLLGSSVIPDASPSNFRRCRPPSASADDDLALLWLRLCWPSLEEVWLGGASLVPLVSVVSFPVPEWLPSVVSGPSTLSFWVFSPTRMGGGDILCIPRETPRFTEESGWHHADVTVPLFESFARARDLQVWERCVHQTSRSSQPRRLWQTRPSPLCHRLTLADHDVLAILTRTTSAEGTTSWMQCSPYASVYAVIPLPFCL